MIRRPSIMELARRAADEAGIGPREVVTRFGTRTWPRRQAQLATMLAARELGFSLNQIGRRLGGRHHTTILGAATQASALAAADASFAGMVARVRGEISSMEVADGNA